MTQNNAITLPTGATVKNIETINLLSGNQVVVDTTTGFEGLTSLSSTSKSGATGTSLTAAATTDITSTESALQDSATSQLVLNGGKNVTVNASGTINNASALTAATGTGAEILVGATTAAAGDVVITNSFKGADTNTSGDVFVKGGKTVAVTQKLTNTTVDQTNVQGDVSVIGDASTTDVTVIQDATATKSAVGTGVVGKTAGDVTISDKNAASATAAGTIATVSVTNAGDVSINSGALTTLNLGGTLGDVNAGTLGALTKAANDTLAVNFTGAVVATGKTLTIDNDIKTLNISGNTTASTIATLAAGGAQKINVSGDAKVTFTANTTGAVTDIVVTNTAGASFGTAIGAGVNFTGGAGNDGVVLSNSFTKAITMGAGDDKVTVGGTTIGTGGSVAAGEGTDTVVMTDVQAATFDGNSTFNTKFTGFEVLEISDAFIEDALDLDGINGVGKVVLTTGVDGTAGINNLVSGGTIVLQADGTTTPALSVGVKGALLGTTDIFNLGLSKSTGVLAAGTVTVANVETVNIDVADANSKGSNAITHTLKLEATAATTVVVAGNNGLTLDNTGNTKITSFDASGVVANDTAAGAGVAATTDTAANLAVTFVSANTDATASVSITGGAGNDTLTGNAAKDTIIGGAGNDQIDGKAGIDTLTGGAGVDTFTIGAGEAGLSGSEKITDFAIGLSGDNLNLTNTVLITDQTNTDVTSIISGATEVFATVKSGIITFSGADAALVDTIAELKLVFEAIDTAAANVAAAVLNGNTYVMQSGTSAVTDIIQLTGVTNATSLATASAEGSILIS